MAFLFGVQSGIPRIQGVPCKFVHLRLGEIGCRFDHRKQDLKTLLYELPRTTTITDIEPVLACSGDGLPYG